MERQMEVMKVGNWETKMVWSRVGRLDGPMAARKDVQMVAWMVAH